MFGNGGGVLEKNQWRVEDNSEIIDSEGGGSSS